MLRVDRGQALAGRYEVMDVIGAGGAARVYRATDTQLGRRVAVKVLDDALARTADPEARQRFLQEAHTTAGFRHPNIVTVFDAGLDGDVLFLVMELVEGATLAEHIRRHAPLAPDDATRIASQLLDGLAEAHRAGVIHRDVKPANVLLDRAGRVRLSDFGIAKHLDDIEDSLTRAGTVMGTPSYIAPEQASGGLLSAATDVYAVGVVLHEMLSGAHAPRGSGGVARAAAGAPLDPRDVRPDTPGGLAELVRQATDPDPDRRFESAAAMRAALDAAGLAAAAPGTSVVHTASAMREPTQTLHAVAAHDLPTAAFGQPHGEATELLAQPFTPSRAERRWRPLAVVLVALLGAALIAVAGSRGTTSLNLPPATSLAPAASLVAPAPVTTLPQPVPATEPVSAPDDAGDSDDDGNGNGNGNGKAKGHKPGRSDD